MPLYRCPNCKRVVERPEGTYYCKDCGIDQVMEKLGVEWYRDNIMGWCRYDRNSFHIVNELYGGYNAVCDAGISMLDYVPVDEVLAIAEKIGVTKIHLAGGQWQRVGRKGYGEAVSVEKAKKLIEDLRYHIYRPRKQ